MLGVDIHPPVPVFSILLFLILFTAKEPGNKAADELPITSTPSNDHP